jgi:hypothetical protein
MVVTFHFEEMEINEENALAEVHSLVNKSTFGNNQRVKQEKRQQQLAWIIL